METGQHSFGSLMANSVVVTGLIVLMILGTICYLAVKQFPIPDFLQQVTLIIVSFFMGGKTQQISANLVRDLAAMRKREG